MVKKMSSKAKRIAERKAMREIMDCLNTYADWIDERKFVFNIRDKFLGLKLDVRKVVLEAWEATYGSIKVDDYKVIDFGGELWGLRVVIDNDWVAFRTYKGGALAYNDFKMELA